MHAGACKACAQSQTVSCACRSADDDEVVPWQGQCDVDIALTWMTEVSSSVYATPIITDLFSDGHKDIVVPSFVHYLEVHSRATLRAHAGLLLAAGSVQMYCEQAHVT